MIQNRLSRLQTRYAARAVRIRTSSPVPSSFLIVRNGKLVFEAYYTGTDGARGVVEFGEQTLHDTRSVTKSITSTLIGIAIDRGYIDSVDVPMARFFPEYAHHLTEEKGRITLKHLLTMTAGFNWDQSGAHNSEPGSLNSEAQMENASDFIEYVLSRETVGRTRFTIQLQQRLFHLARWRNQAGIGYACGQIRR